MTPWSKVGPRKGPVPSLEPHTMPLDPHSHAGPAPSSPSASSAVPHAAGANRNDVAMLTVRMSRVEDALEQGGRSHLTTVLAGGAALLGFVATTLAWPLGNRLATIDETVRATAGLLTRSTAATDAALSRFEGRLTAQGETVDALTAAVAGVEAAGREMQAALVRLERHAGRTADGTDLVSRQLTNASLEFSTLRRELEAQFARHREAAATGRTEMLDAVATAIGRVEEGVLRQTTELKAQRDELDASTARMRRTQHRILGEATGAVTVQLEGLRQILDGLRREISDVDDRLPALAAESGTDTAATNPAAPEVAPLTVEESADADRGEPTAPVAEVATQPTDSVTD